MQKSSGFTLAEVAVVIVIIIILSSMVLFVISQYANRSNDSNVEGNLAILIPSGEAYYTGPGNNSYGAPGSYGEPGVINFCNSAVVVNAFSQIPLPPLSSPFCNVNISGDKWAACAQLFTDKEKAFCVDSRGVKEDIDDEDCNIDIIECP